MKHALLIGLFVLFLSMNTLAFSAMDIVKADCTTLTYDGKPLSEAKIALPNDLANFLDGETINLIPDKGPRISGSVSKGVLSNLSCGRNPSATMDVYATPTALEHIAESSTPLKTLKQEMANGQINFMATGLVAQAKTFFLSIVLAFT